MIFHAALYPFLEDIVINLEPKTMKIRRFCEAEELTSKDLFKHYDSVVRSKSRKHSASNHKIVLHANNSRADFRTFQLLRIFGREF